ncbi:hypothetical protein DFS33DRAFT_914904 [Desarmillaria ectypa]|nr:hypothetical protein DFS33DRAFT_914904 [Desarmillaria ectypa]
MAPSAPSTSAATGSIERIYGVSFNKVVSGTDDRYIEFCAVGTPPIGLGSPGDVYIDKTPQRHVLYGFTTKWERWNGPQKKKESDFLRHPKHPKIVLWATAWKRGWISLEVLKNKRQTDTENNILTEQMKADEKNKVTGTPFQAEGGQRQPAPPASQVSQSVGPTMVKIVPRETRRVSTGTAFYPSPALSTWVAGLDSPDQSSPMLSIFSTISPIPQGVRISPMYPTLSPMPALKSPMLVTDSPMSCTSSTLTAPPVRPSTPHSAPPHLDLARINRSLSSPKSRTNASASSMPKPFISPVTSTPRQPGMSSPLTEVISKPQHKILSGSLRPKPARTSPSRLAEPSSTGLQREHPTSNPARSTPKRKRARSPASEAEVPLQRSPASSSLTKMKSIPAHDEERSRHPKAAKTFHHPSSVVSPSKESASVSRVTTQCSVERKVPHPKKLPAVVIDLTLSDDDDVSVPVLSLTALSPPQRESPAAPSPSLKVSPTAPSPPPRVSLDAPSPPPPDVSALKDVSVEESDMHMCDDSVPETLELQYPESEESKTVPLLPVDFSDDVTVYGTLGFKNHHICAIFQMNEAMVCRLCQEDQAVFDLDASFHDLASHCEASHGEACHLIVELTPEQTRAWLAIALVA